MPTPFLRYFLSVLFVFFSAVFLAQDWKLPVTSKVEMNDKPLAGATVTVYKNGKSESQVVTGSDGKFRVELLPNGNYKLEVTKAGLIKKYFTFNTNGVPPDDAKDGFKGFDIRAVELFDPPTECDVSFLNQPLIKVSYDAGTKNFEYDKSYSDQVLDQLANVADCIENEKAKTMVHTRLELVTLGLLDPRSNQLS